jgi:hypothetical protein
MAEIDRLSGGEAIVASDVGQHQMWAAQFIRFNEPRLWVNSGGLGSMGFGLPVGDGRADVAAGQTGLRDRGRRRLPDVHARSWPRSPTTACREDHHHEQRLPGHGAPVAGAVLQQPPARGELDCFPMPSCWRRPTASRADRRQAGELRGARRKRWPSRARIC